MTHNVISERNPPMSSGSNDDRLDEEFDPRRLDSAPPVSLVHLFLVFLRIGSVAFGGFMSLIAFIESVVVQRHRWLQHQQMLDAISLANLLPGPQAVNVVALTGYRVRGYPGALVAMSGVILPSFVLIVVLGHVYFQYGSLPALQSVFRGFTPAVAAIILTVVWRMGSAVIKGGREIALVAASLLALFLLPGQFRVYGPIMVLVSMGLLGYFLFRREMQTDAGSAPAGRTGRILLQESLKIAALVVPLLVLWLAPLPLERNSLLFLGITFAGLSLILFGGGYVFIPVIGSLVILDYGWLNVDEFNAGIALGQITPGPIVITATFIGYKVAGLAGAIVATLGIFLPPALLMISASRFINAIEHSATTRAILKGIRCAVIGLITLAGFVILHSALPGQAAGWSAYMPALTIFVSSLLALLVLKLDMVWIIPLAGLFGYLLY